MESALATQIRLIEYPNDLSGCEFLHLGHKHLLYICSHSNGGLPFVVVLGFYAGQKEDIVTKDLIEPVGEENWHSVKKVLTRSLAPEYSCANVFFF